MKKLIAISLFISLLVAGMASAQIISFDENGNGTIDGRPLDYGIGDSGVDPVPTPTLFYYLPFPVVQGDLQIFEPDGTISDVLRFTNTPGANFGRVYVYSDNTDIDVGKADLADVGIPQPWTGGIVVTMPEAGSENGWNGVIWQPTPNQPGGLTATAPITYNFTSDVPEPVTLALLGLGGLLLRKRK
jgi:hypothetical protein